MTNQYGYYLPLGQVFASDRFLSIAPKMPGFGPLAEHKSDKDGTPVWTVSALVSRGEEVSQTESFSLIAPSKLADSIGQLPELTLIKIHGLSGGKWVQNGSDKTNWSSQITGVEWMPDYGNGILEYSWRKFQQFSSSLQPAIQRLRTKSHK